MSNSNDLKDWFTYFETRLTVKGQFILEDENRRGATDQIIFKSTNPNNLNTIQIAILDNGSLITFQIHNPMTPGFSEQQKREFFYKYSFHPTEGYGEPGLEFIQLNIDHFDKFLKKGLKGKEIQYYKENTLIKSEVFQFYAENGDADYGTKIQFEKKRLWSKILDLYKSNNNLYDSKKEIQIE